MSGPMHSLKILEWLSVRQKGCSPSLKWCIFKPQIYSYKTQYLGASICVHSLTQFTAVSRRWCHQRRHIFHTSFSRGRIYTFLENVELAKCRKWATKTWGRHKLFYKSKALFLCGLWSAKMWMLQHILCNVKSFTMGWLRVALNRMWKNYYCSKEAG